MRISDWSSDVCSSDLSGAQEIMPLIAELAGMSRAAKGHHPRLHPVDQGGKLLPRFGHVVAVELAPALVQRLPHVLRQHGAGRLGVGAGLQQAGTDGGGIVEVEHQESDGVALRYLRARSEEHTSELQSLMRISYAVFC